LVKTTLFISFKNHSAPCLLRLFKAKKKISSHVIDRGKNSEVLQKYWLEFWKELSQNIKIKIHLIYCDVLFQMWGVPFKKGVRGGAMEGSLAPDAGGGP